MKPAALLAVTALVALAGCGDDGGSAPKPSLPKEEPAKETEGAAKPDREGAAIIVRDSQYGPMLFGSNRQAIYIFENDSKGKTACYGECAEAWPPVVTKGEPKAEKGSKASLLGTIKRRDGTRQVTYAGQPLYYYAHEDPGEVRCHNVNLNGGFWWVVGPDGRRRA
jgi:predicted lipoprotein with Yx(FWY)xxD motif